LRLLGEESGAVGSKLVPADSAPPPGSVQTSLLPGMTAWPPIRRDVVMSERKRLTDPAVVVLPDEIDVLNAASVGERLAAAIASGVAVVIADLTMTTFCDCAGVNSLLLAHRKASGSNAELRLAVRSRPVLRILALLGADQVLPVYPDLGESAVGFARSGISFAASSRVNVE
jgi:anti-anti-sigma factor